MFSGIVETTSPVLAADQGDNLLQIYVQRPPSFNDLVVGASIAVDGVCLTVEEFDAGKIRFSLGPETLKITGWLVGGVIGRVVNLERSLRLQDRIDGHLVTGHVDDTCEIKELGRQSQTQQMTLQLPVALRPYVWSKGSVTLNGVSLTVNATDVQLFSVGLIPETLRRTNLGRLQAGDRVNLEVDNLARGLVHWARLQKESV